LGVLTEKEVHSKVEIKLEAYTKIKIIEFKVAINIAKTLILPAVLKQLGLLADANAAVKSAGIKVTEITADIKALNKVYSDIQAGISNLDKEMIACEKAPAFEHPSPVVC